MEYSGKSENTVIEPVTTVVEPVTTVVELVETTSAPTLKNSRYSRYKALHKMQKTASQIYQ